MRRKETIDPFLKESRWDVLGSSPPALALHKNSRIPGNKQQTVFYNSSCFQELVSRQRSTMTQSSHF